MPASLSSTRSSSAIGPEAATGAAAPCCSCGSGEALPAERRNSSTSSWKNSRRRAVAWFALNAACSLAHGSGPTSFSPSGSSSNAGLRWAASASAIAPSSKTQLCLKLKLLSRLPLPSAEASCVAPLSAIPFWSRSKRVKEVLDVSASASRAAPASPTRLLPSPRRRRRWPRGRASARLPQPVSEIPFCHNCKLTSRAPL
mmetsp:Transcript_56779/g.166169  ORF Transcript_56779/g.166169 Transcript_56779/m.166169 type:complete len:200 (-) Transcript_56779:690-1289(-)